MPLPQHLGPLCVPTPCAVCLASAFLEMLLTQPCALHLLLRECHCPSALSAERPYRKPSLTSQAELGISSCAFNK